MEIKIKDVKEFLEENGFDWEDVLRVNNGRTMHFIKKIPSLDEKITLAHLPIELKRGTSSDSKEKSIEVRLTGFVVEVRAEDNTFVTKYCLNNDWINFLLRKYGKDYEKEVDEVISFLEQNSNSPQTSLIKILVTREYSKIKYKQAEDEYNEFLKRRKKRDTYGLKERNLKENVMNSAIDMIASEASLSNKI